MLACNYKYCVEAPQNQEAEVGILRAWNIILKLMDEVVDIRKDRIVLGSRICVHPDYGHQGVITKIMKLSLDLSTKQGYTLACGYTNNPNSMRICLRLGFKNVKTVNVNTLEEGIFDLSCLEYKIINFFTKRLRSETILSSKL
nr:uncharacterized protein LOC128700062 [Cherax quadricarinatus]